MFASQMCMSWVARNGGQNANVVTSFYYRLLQLSNGKRDTESRRAHCKNVEKGLEDQIDDEYAFAHQQPSLQR
jgi:hypothetical protein